MNATASFPHRVGAPYKPAQNLADLMSNRAHDARVRETVAKNSLWHDLELFWRGRAQAFEIAADNLRRSQPVPVGYVETVCPTTGRRDSYKLTEDGLLIFPLPN